MARRLLKTQLLAAAIAVASTPLLANRITDAYWPSELENHSPASDRELRSISEGATQGNSELQLALGAIYARGDVVARDYGQSVAWYEKASMQGNKIAQYHLGKV